MSDAVQMEEAIRENRIEDVKVLLQQGMSADIYLEGRGPALQWASALGHTEIVALLLEAGADVDARGKVFQHTALHAAANEECARLLLEAGADVHARDRSGGTPMFGFAVREMIGGMRLLLEHGAAVNVVSNTGNTPLLFAAKDRSVKSVRFLIEQGAELNRREQRFDKTALMCAAHEDGKKGLQVVKLLLQAGADPDIMRSDGMTALTFACNYAEKKYHPEVVRALIEGGGPRSIWQMKTTRRPCTGPFTAWKTRPGGSSSWSRFCWRAGPIHSYASARIGTCTDVEKRRATWRWIRTSSRSWR